MTEPDLPTLEIRRVILFAEDVAKLANFYRDVLGLTPDEGEPEPGWAQFRAGGCHLAIHGGGAAAAKGRPRVKLVFGASDVAACRAVLVARGAPMGKLLKFQGIEICDGKDPEGNVFQLSSRP